MSAVFAVCRVEEIPSRQGRGFLLARRGKNGGEQPWRIFIVRWGRHVFAYENACPHQGTRLDWESDQFMDGSGERLICGKHGALFELDTGRCFEGPCHGAMLTAIPARIDDGDICIEADGLIESE